MLLVLIETTKHFSLLLALLYLYALLLPKLTSWHNRAGVIAVQSLLFGMVTVVSMTMSMTIAPGQYGDSRTIIVATAAATAGPIPGFAAAIIATLARSAYPLDGFMNGTISVVVAAVLGSLYYRLEAERRVRGSLRELLVFGVVLALSKLAILLLFGADDRLAMFRLVMLPALVLYPGGFMLSFLLLRREKRVFERAQQSAEHRQQFEVAIQSSPVGIVICRRADRLCVYANEMAAKALNTTVGALTGWRGDSLLSALAEKARGVDGVVENQTLMLTLPNGTARWFLVSSRAVRYQNRDCQLIALQDITEERENQQRLAFSEARFRRFADASDEGILIASESGIVDANKKAAQLFGYAPDEMIGMPLVTLVPLAERGALEARMRSGDDSLMAGLGLRKSGSRFDAEMAIRQIDADGGSLWLVTVRDLTERKQAEVQRLALLVEQQKVRTLHDFIRATSHDLRTPLAIINTSLYLARRSDDAARQAAQIDKAEGQVTLLGDMLDRIDDWVHLHYVDALTLLPVDVNALLTDACQRVAQQAAERNINLSLDLAPDLPFVCASIGELTTAVNALLTNAIVFTPAQGSVMLRTYADDGLVVVEVKDTGIGMDAEALRRVFEPFFKVDPARAAGVNGVGLGLTLVQRIAELHGGTVTMESAPGCGTTATLSLRASAAAPVSVLTPPTALLLEKDA